MSHRLHGRTDFPLIRSAALRNNPLSDPTEREILVHLPAGYEEAATARRYPVVFLLPAYGATHRSMLTFRLWERNVFEIHEELVRKGECAAAILVVPDACNRHGGSQFLDSSATGEYQSFLVDEVVPFVDSLYRTIPKREARAIVGRSSGGFGALRVGIDRPEVFAAIGSHAGDALFSATLRPGFTQAAITIGRSGGLSAFLERVEKSGPASSDEFLALSMVAYGAAYAPMMDEPYPHVGLPFDPETALPIPEIWKRWRAQDPVALLERFPDALVRADLVYLDAGDRDEHGLQLGTRRLAALLEERGARVHHEEFAGGHRGTTERFATSLPRLCSVLATS